MKTVSQHSIIDSSSTTPWSRKLYTSANELWQDSQQLHHWYIVWRTMDGKYEDFKPDSVFYVGKSPTAYLKKVNTNEISEKDVRKWQRFLWNQAVVPMLVIKSRTKVRVYTAYTQPREIDSTKNIECLLEDASDVLELDKLWTSMEAGTIYEANPELFNRAKSVDRFLLANLTVVLELLALTQDGGVNEKNLKFVHQFLTRLLFVCYLIEKDMIKGKHFDYEPLKKLKAASKNDKGYFLRHLFSDLNTHSKRKEALCKIFARVKDRFNGSLFSGAIKTEKERYNELFISVVDKFLRALDLTDNKHQLQLDFWAYDFKVIPIEIISAVYESFLNSQGKNNENLGEVNLQEATGAYYTPLHLAELTVDIALENIKKPIHELKVLDPACGSGVFLVSLFGRMADSLRKEKGYKENNKKNIEWARELSPLLSKLYGIDVNPTACHITCFSLYLALLERLTPMDVEYLRKHNKHKKALLPLMADTSPESYNTIHHDNFFNPELDLKEKDFDIVIGNPPWVSRGKQKDEVFLKWISADGKKNENLRGPEKQIAHGFMWKAIDYLAESGQACLLLPASVLLNTNTNHFQKAWLQSAKLERVVNFSDLRHVLFEGAIHPCVAMLFTSELNEELDNKIRYESPKIDIRSQKGGAIYIREEDTTNLRLKDILNFANKSKAPLIWKSHFWGTWRDQRLLSRLSDLPKLNKYTGTPRKPKRFIKGQGFQIFNPKPTSDIAKIKRKKKPEGPWWSTEMPFLPSNEMTDLVVPSGICKPVGNKFKSLLFPRDPKLFKGPKVLISQGSRNMKVAFCNFEVIFQSAIQTITGKVTDDDNLRFLAVAIKSDLIQYFLFHTSTSWAIEREKTLFYELLSMPFFLPEDSTCPKRAKKIVDLVASEVEYLEREIEKGKWFGEEDRLKNEIERISKNAEPLIREYYGIDKYESMLIDDTLNLAVKSFHQRESSDNIPTLANVEDENAIEYTQTLCEMLNNFGEGSSFKVNGEVIRGRPYSVIQLSLTNRIKRSVSISTATDRLAEVFERMKSLLEEQSGRFVFCQNLKVFAGDDLYILKPMQMRFWSKTAALNDADEIAGAILNSRGEEE